MKKLIYFGIIFLLALSLALIIVPVGLTEKQVDNIIKIIPAFFAAASLMVTISLYDRFGLKKMLYEKKIKAMLGYIETLRNLGFGYNVQFQESWGFQSLSIGYVRLSSDMSKEKMKLKHFLDYPMFVYGNNIDTSLKKLYPHIDDMYLPKQLSRFPYWVGFHEELYTIPQEFSIVMLGDIQPEQYEGKLLSNLNGNQITLGEFINTVEAFMQECREWIEKHTDLDKEIKI